MNKPQKYYPFTEKDIDKENYAASLLALCAAHGLISEEKAENIKKIILAVFNETLEQFTHRESGSVSMDHAKLIYESVLYRADIYFLHLNSFSEAVEKIIQVDFALILAEGSRLVLQYFNDSQPHFNRARANALNLPLEGYRNMLSGAFETFKANYSARFAAKEIPMKIEYDLLYPINAPGVLFVYKYYKALALENAFCSLFSISEIKNLLTNYAKPYCVSHYSSLDFNVCEVMLNNFLAVALIGGDKLSLRITPSDIRSIYDAYRFSTREEIREAVKKVLTRHYGQIGNHGVIMYIRPYLDTFAERLYTALQNNSAEYLIVAF